MVAETSGVLTLYLPAMQAVQLALVLAGADQLPSGHSCCCAGVLHA